jgi:YHS domain-containing protein
MVRLLLLLILIVVVGRSFWRLVDGIVEGASRSVRTTARDSAVQMVRDPVCGTFVVRARAVALGGGEPVYFCSTRCRDRYRAKSA